MNLQQKKEMEMDLQQKEEMALHQEKMALHKKVKTKKMIKRSALAMKELKTGMRICMKDAKTRTP